MRKRQSAPHSINIPIELMEWVDSISTNRSAVVVKALMEYRNRNDNFDSKLRELEAKRRKMLNDLDLLDEEIKLVNSFRVEGEARDGQEETESIDRLKKALGRNDNE